MSAAAYDAARAYDEVPYDAGAIPGAHPDSLAVVGVQWGMQPPPVERCRVLELGCSSGDNLLALAVALPAADFYGIDISPRQIETGRARVAAAGVTNVTLECRGIEEPSPDTRSFDYIICHGVYSWVPRSVQQQILHTCSTLLAPQGLAYISFNTLPGWHMKQQLRNMLLYHVHGMETTVERLAQAHALLAYLGAALKDRTDGYGSMLRGEVESLQDQPDSYICHEYLEDVNTPESLHDFVAGAAAHGLQYVDETRPAAEPPKLPANARQTLATGGADRIATEHYLDFLAGRTFRRSVLCRADVRLNALPAERALPSLRVSVAVAATDAAADLTSDAAVEFRFGRGQRLKTNHPAMKVALALLGRSYPERTPFDVLCRNVEAQLTAVGVAVPADTRDLLANWLNQCHRGGLADLHVWQPPIALEPADRPRASPLARLEAADGCTYVTSLRHVSVLLHPFDRAVLALLDGATGRAQLLPQVAGIELPDAMATPAEHVEGALRRLARSALLLS